LEVHATASAISAGATAGSRWAFLPVKFSQRWWMVTLNGQKIRLARGRENKSDAERAFHELMAVRPQRPDAHDARVCDLAEAFLEFARRKK